MTSRNTRSQVLGFIGWLALVLLAGAIGAWASIDAASFYDQLVRPDWAPPASVFGPVWTTLYVLMAVAAWMVWRVGDTPRVRGALQLFLAQLVLNTVWSWLFFGWRLGGLAFIDILVLVCLIVATLIAFWRIKPLAGGLLMPYLCWVGFATALNYSVWQLNPGALG